MLCAAACACGTVHRDAHPESRVWRVSSRAWKADTIVACLRLANREQKPVQLLKPIGTRGTGNNAASLPGCLPDVGNLLQGLGREITRSDAQTAVPMSPSSAVAPSSPMNFVSSPRLPSFQRTPTPPPCD